MYVHPRARAPHADVDGCEFQLEDIDVREDQADLGVEHDAGDEMPPMHPEGTLQQVYAGAHCTPWNASPGILQGLT